MNRIILDLESESGPACVTRIEAALASAQPGDVVQARCKESSMGHVIGLAQKNGKYNKRMVYPGIYDVSFIKA